MPTSNWSVLWSFVYPFVELEQEISNLRPHQRVNHWPGTGFLHKLTLVTSDFRFVPKAFRLPNQKDDFLKFAEQHPEKLFVQKNNGHRGVQVKTVSEMNVTASGTFIQEFITNPFLIDGFKFDIGVYTYITSVDPLRIYVSDTVQFRFCPVKYHPFDAAVKDKYVVGEHYQPMYDVPSFKHALNEQRLSYKEAFSAYVAANTGKDPRRLWQEVMSIIRTVVLAKESDMIESLAKFKTKRPHPFFELVRFDLILDDNLKPYLMEVNMSPNLYHYFPRNRLIYEHVLFSFLSLVGLGRHVGRYPPLGPVEEEAEMEASQEDMAVFPETCASPQCLVKTGAATRDMHSVCSLPQCEFCVPCLSGEEKSILRAAYLEHVNRKSARRIFPPPIRQTLDPSVTVNLTTFEDLPLRPLNRWMYRWFHGMCLKDVTWCS